MTVREQNANLHPIPSSNSTNNTSGMFGSGPSKPAFGASNSTLPGLFGGNSSSNTFGATNKYVSRTIHPLQKQIRSFVAYLR